jgi:hypothetical protein
VHPGVCPGPEEEEEEEEGKYSTKVDGARYWLITKSKIDSRPH